MVALGACHGLLLGDASRFEWTPIAAEMEA